MEEEWELFQDDCCEAMVVFVVIVVASCVEYAGREIRLGIYSYGEPGRKGKTWARCLLYLWCRCRPGL